MTAQRQVVSNLTCVEYVQNLSVLCAHLKFVRHIKTYECRLCRLTLCDHYIQYTALEPF